VRAAIAPTTEARQLLRAWETQPDEKDLAAELERHLRLRMKRRGMSIDTE
jgi:hypothetical protein